MADAAPTPDTDDDEPTAGFPVEFEGEKFWRGRTRVSGTAEAPAPLHRGDTVAHLVVSHVKDVKLGMHEGVPTVVYGLDATESFEVPLDDVQGLLTEARRLQRERDEAATGQYPLLDDLEAERAAEADDTPGDPPTEVPNLTAAQEAGLLVVAKADRADGVVHPSTRTDPDEGTVNGTVLTALVTAALVDGDHHLTPLGREHADRLADAADLPEGVTRLGH